MDLTELRWRFELGVAAPLRQPPGTPPRLRNAAVLLAFQAGSNGVELLLTQRPHHLKAHPGQVSFPGGKQEPQDQSLLDTALREAYEEIGLAPTNVEILGTLPQHHTITGFNIMPVVGIVQQPFRAILDPGEVSALFTVPLTFLLQPNNRHVMQVQRRQQSHPVTFIPYGNRLIWGATAAIIDTFCAIVGSDTQRITKRK
ncbi:CoA pyrophosphatase [Shewanella fodinae]|uniref:NUDIX domain-containing protein n=1 Tax=Shewanella fodinae TaxID=552357 RepID=A0A4R2FCU4_9GAMM|nr:CoA pyrophosphatase [Shewanella fodinae]TCN82333.1 NUDIX domain-containing protein [Shewanella fodinae]